MEATERSNVEFRVLGPVEVLRDGKPLPLGGPRQQALLALLLLEAGRPVSADRLIDELWAGEPPDGAEVSLRSYVSRLRSALGDGVGIPGTAAGYTIEAPEDAIDARRFERLLRDGEDALRRRSPGRGRDQLALAIGLWRARPFGKLGGDGALRVEAERQTELRLRATELRLDAELELGAGDQLVVELEALVREHPFREGLWRRLMLALYRANRQADALEVYRRARKRLKDELGLEPGEDLERLQGQILRHDVPPARPPEHRHNLPAAITSFIGREAALAAVARKLADHRLVTLTGVGGVGKTRLAIEAARAIAAEMPDGAWFVDLSSIVDPDLVVGLIAAALEVPEAPGTPLPEQLVSAVRERDLLLLLDNCEHLRDASAAIVERLLRGAPGLRVLATSRELLGVPGEVDHPVPPLDQPAVGIDDVAAARSSEAVRLLLDRARAVRPGLADSDDAIRIATRICADLDGLPLAIELAAARARALSLPDIADRLADRFRFLVSWRRLTTARHRTLREAMDWSFDLLSADEQSLLAGLSVFAGSFDLPAVAAVCTDGDDEVALRLIERLVDASLVVPLEIDGETRYRLLETVREYAAERLAGGDATPRRQAHAAYFLDVARLAQVRGTDQAAAMVRLDRDVDNLRAALDYAGALDNLELELRLAGAMWRYWWVRGHLAEGRTRIEAVLSRAADRSPTEFSDVLFGAGILAWCVGDYARGRAVGEQLLEIAAASESLADAHAGNKVLGMVALRERRYDESERYAQRTVELARALGNELDIVLARLNLAVLIMDSGRIEEAIPIFEEGLDFYRRTDNAEGVGLANLNLGEARYLLGDHEAAGEFFEAARAAYSEIGWRAHVGHALRGLAGVAARQGRHEAAAGLLGRAEAVMGSLGASEDDFAPAIAREAEALARTALGEMGFTDAFDNGQQEEALAP